MKTENGIAAMMERYFDRLWPICRSITGNGLRESLHILQEIIPLQLHEVPTGTAVFDWTIPEEWNIRDAWIEGPDGKKYAEFRVNNLHVMNYSMPVEAEIPFEELEKHIYTLPEKPEWIPYMTSYYRKAWGFCMSHNEFLKMPRQGLYKVRIDADHKTGSLTYGELVLPGKTDREILISTYVCHPSMANNELSGPLVSAFLFQQLIKSIPNRKYTYRFVFAPETIGVIAFLAARGMHLKEKLDAGYVVTCAGDAGAFHYKRSKREHSAADKAAEHILKFSGEMHSVRPFAIGGSDERQYCSAGFNLPVGSLMRTPYKEYSQYHTSADDKSFVSFEAMEQTVNMYLRILKALEYNEKYQVVQPYCELQLGKRNLYLNTGGNAGLPDFTGHLLHFLSYADGTADLIDIAEKRGVSIETFYAVVDTCKAHQLIHA